MAWLEAQRWFLPVITVVFITATIEILCTSLPLPLGGLSVLGVFLLTLFLLTAIYLYVRFLQPKDVRRPRSLLLLGALFLIVLLMTRYGLAIIAALYVRYPEIPFSAMRAALPVPVAGVLLATLFNARLAFAGSLSFAILASIVLGAPLEYFLYAFVGSLVGIFAVAGVESRTVFFRAGAWIAVGNAYV